jgi:predicted dehydrogenase
VDMSAEPGTLRFGILSTADIAVRKVIPGMRRSTRGEVVAIASRDGERARVVADQLGIPRSHASYEALLADPEVDAVYIPLPNHLHAEWAIAAVAAGKHVLCEKPLAMTAADAQRMADAAQDAGVHLMEAFMYRHHPSWLATVELVASGRIGTLTSVQSWFSYYNDDQANIRNIRAVGGGALYDIGCYNVSLSRLLFASEPIDVAASLQRDPIGGTDIQTSAILRFETGVATFTCSTRLEADQRVHIYGTDGRISIDIPFNIPPDRPTRIHLTHGGDAPVAPATETFTFETQDPYAAEVDAFAGAILEGRPTPVPAADAVANLRVIERIFAAAEGGPGQGGADQGRALPS